MNPGRCAGFKPWEARQFQAQARQFQALGGPAPLFAMTCAGVERQVCLLRYVARCSPSREPGPATYWSPRRGEASRNALVLC